MGDGCKNCQPFKSKCLRKVCVYVNYSNSYSLLVRVWEAILLYFMDRFHFKEPLDYNEIVCVISY